MLHAYPVEATLDNWLHENVCRLLRILQQKLDQGENTVENQQSWKSLVTQAVVPEKREFFSKAYGIRDRFFEYKTELCKLAPEKRSEILEVLDSQNRISHLLDGTEQIQLLSSKSVALHEVAKRLFVFCYERLLGTNARTRQYEVIFKSLDDKICPFCGIDRVMDPEDTAQDQDHYLAKSIYPFAAVNMKNLVPMCRSCNRDYKKNIDMIVDENGARRKAFNPYHCDPPRISVSGSSPIPDATPIGFNWEIEFLSSVEEAENWDRVFSIRERYRRDVLNHYFGKWLGAFAGKCAKDRKRGIIGTELAEEEIRCQLAQYQEDKAEFPSPGLAGFLEPLVFEMLLKLYDSKHERIVNFVRDAVVGIP